MVIPAISPRQDIPCAICGRGANDPHHVQHRSAGGTDHAHNIEYLCRDCHQRCHGDIGKPAWSIAHTEHFLYVMDGDEIIVQRPIGFPEGWDEGVFVAQMEQAPRDLMRLSSMFQWLSDDGLVAAGEALYGLYDAGWHARACLFRVAVRRSPWGERNARLLDLARQFDVSLRQARKEIEALSVAEDAGIVQNLHTLPPPDVILAARDFGDVPGALELYTDRVTAGRYSVSQFKAELKSGNTDSLAAPPEYHKCPECGNPHVRLTPADRRG